MERSNPENPVPQPVDQPAPKPINPSQIYPNPSQIYPTPTSTPGPSAAPNAVAKPQRLGNKPPVGVIIISGLITLQSAFNIYTGLRENRPLSLITPALQIALGLGLLTLHETARRIYVVLGVIFLILEVPLLLFGLALASSSSQSQPGIYALFILVGLAIQIGVLVYLTRPAVKSYFR